MPYKRRISKKYGRKRKPRAGAKKKSWKKRKTHYRKTMAIPLQISNQRPASRLVKFEGLKRFAVINAGPGAPQKKSIAYYPASFMGDIQITQGTWTDDTVGDIIDPQSYQFWFGQYKYYKVISSHLDVVVRPLGDISENDYQNQNILLLARVPDAGTFSNSTGLQTMDQARGAKKRAWTWAPNTVSRPCYNGIGYKAKTEHNIKDIKDASNLRAVTTYNSAAGENTFFEVVLGGALDNLDRSHPDCLLELKISYYCLFDEPTIENIPLGGGPAGFDMGGEY